MKTELYKKHRPTDLKRVWGQPEPVKVLNEMIKNKRVPHTLLFSGPSGCGKTTLARILKKEMDCGDQDFKEINCSILRGIDMVRFIQKHLSLSPISGSCRIWHIDECHRMTGEAQDAFLKMLEDTPSHAYFFLSTTDPQKLKKTIHTRSTKIVVKLLKNTDMKRLINYVCRKEQIIITEECADRLVEVSEGSARSALVSLNAIMGIEDDEEMLNAIQNIDMKAQAIELARALISPNPSWQKISGILKELDDDPESVRWLVLGYANSVLLGGGKLAEKAWRIIYAFQQNFYDSKKAGLTASCWEVVHDKMD